MKTLKISFALASLAGFAGAQATDSAAKLAAEHSEKIQALEGKIDGLNEDYLETKGAVLGLKKLKFGGLVQARYQYYLDKKNYNAANPDQQGGFIVRRGRLKASYDDGAGAEYVMQFDIKEKGLSPQDVFAKWTEQWTKTFSFQMGLQDIPFGYEIGYSSSTMEWVERSQFERNAMFKDEKDLGAILSAKPKVSGIDHLEAKLALLNGYGINGQPSAQQDPANIVARVQLGKDLPEQGVSLSLGASYFTDTRTTDSAYFEVDGSSSFKKSASADKELRANIFGADAQVTTDLSMVPGLMGAKFLGELYTGTAIGNKSGNKRSVASTDILYLRNVLGWYAAYVQNIGNSLQTIVRYDVYDANTDVSGDEVGKNGTGKADLSTGSLYLGLNWFATGNLKFTLGYDMTATEESKTLGNKDPDDDMVTFQTQVKF